MIGLTMSLCSLFLLFFQVSNKALVIHAIVKEGRGVNAAVNGVTSTPARWSSSKSRCSGPELLQVAGLQLESRIYSEGSQFPP